MGYNKINLWGEQVCDYLYIQNFDINNPELIDMASEPKWNTNTVLLSNFSDEDLNAGNSTIVGNLNGYELRRRKNVETHTEHVATIREETGKIIDYMVANNTAYTYYLYPHKASSESGITLSPSISKEITPRWDYWSLMVVDESEEENVFYLNKMFKFELNLTTDDMNNNAVISVIHNFTKYPTIQYGTSNFWSSALTSLCGYINCTDDEYIQTPDMINELKSLTSDTRRKFLKDMDGNVWEVKITAPINISTEDNTVERVKSAKVSWTEVGETAGISIINNPALFATSWLLTKTGRAKPYIEYEWDNKAVWDNTKRWTAKEDNLIPDSSNIGRDLFSEEDEL